MNFIRDFFTIIIEGLHQLPDKTFWFCLLLAILIAGIFFFICNYYLLLWNKNFNSTVAHKILSSVAAILSFFFVLSFFGLKHMKEVSTSKIDQWENSLLANNDWKNNTFTISFYKVKSSGLENFSAVEIPEKGGHIIPISNKQSQVEVANITANEACINFSNQHPFLSKIIWSTPNIPSAIVASDIDDFFKNRNKDNARPYEMEDAVKLASTTIRRDLEKQVPRTVKISRILLIISFIVVQSIPFSLIGLAAYKNLQVNT
jgi:hypothetical protein